MAVGGAMPADDERLGGVLLRAAEQVGIAVDQSSSALPAVAPVGSGWLGMASRLKQLHAPRSLSEI